MEMVGMMAGVVLAAAGAGGLREQAVAYLNEAKIQGDTSAKIDTLKRVKEIVLYRDPSLLPEFVPHLMELQTELASPIRKCLAEIIEEIGLKRSEHIPLMVPVLLALFRDETPVVARRAMATGSNLFRSTLEQVAYQGIYTANVEKWLEDSWLWMTRLKDAIYSAAQQHGNDGVRFVAVKFVETAILLFTPDPEGPSQPPPLQQNTDEIVRGFNVTWIIGGHPVLDAGVLGQEASRNLSLLLDQLRTSEISKLSGPVAIVLVNSLAAIAKKRPSLYGRILPVLLGLGPNCEAIKGAQVSSVVHALKNAFLFLLKCTHSGAAPWRERLVSALRAMNAGDGAEAAIRQADRMLRNAEKERAFRDSRSIKDERMPSSMPPSFADSVRKRPIPQENGNQANDVDDSLSKRVRPMSSAALMAPSFQQPQSIMNAVQDPGGPSGENSTGAVAMDSAELSPLQQMIAVIGALVAKGERAAASIDLLITSLPADTLADIVIENMRNLPATAPPLPASVATGGSTVVTPQPTSAGFITPVVPSVPTAAASASEGNTAVQAPSEYRRDLRRDPRRMDPRRVAVPVGVPQTPVGVSDTLVKTEELGIEVSGGASSSVAVKTEGLIVLNNRESQGAEQSSCIPGISEFASIQVKVEKPEEPLMPDIVSSSVTAALLQFTTPPLTSGQQITALPTSVSSCSGSVVTVATGDPAVLASANDSIPSVPVVSVKSEQGLTSVISAPVLKETQVLLPGAVPGGTSLGVSSAIPIVHLSDDQQLRLSKAALVRILEGYKPIDAAGGGELRIALLARLIAQSHTDEETWGVLQKHILADYQNQKGHELAIHTLYQLYAEQMSVVDGSGTIAVAATAYEKFLLSVAQGLRDNLPPSDKSLSRLLGEAPVLSEETLKLLEALCNPEVKEGSETPSGDRITQGLSAFWSLILLRPPTRAACLDIVLQCAVHELDEVRTKAIRLVANKLYPISYVSQNIEDFATKMVHSVVETRSNEEGLKDAMESDEATTHLQPAEKHEVLKQKPSNGDQNVAGASTGADGTIVEEEQHRISRNPVSLAEAQRCMSLYFALCTKKHSLLGQLFIVYGRAPKGVKQAVHRHMPVLIRTIGSSSPDLLQIISDPPVGSKNLLLQVLHILTESSTPSPELIASVKQLYETKLKDAGILIPILSCLSKDEVLPIFPRLVDLPTETFKAALARILQGSVHTGPALTPAEVLIAIHGIDPERDSVSLAKVKDACSVCFQQRTVFTQQVLAKVLNQLVEQTPLPMLFMRTVIQAVGAFRSLVNFVMEILSRLVSKQIWKSPNLWVGFLKCADQTQPHSFHVLLQLPAVQLEKALHKHPNLRSPLTTHASQTNIRSTLPRATLVVLGFAQDAPPTESSVQNQSTADNTPTPPAPQGLQAVESVPIT